nr:hypothetical protein [Fusobacterium necrophorum]
MSITVLDFITSSDIHGRSREKALLLFLDYEVKNYILPTVREEKEVREPRNPWAKKLVKTNDLSR